MIPKFAALLLVAAAPFCYAASPVEGDWEGTLKPGGVELRLRVHIKSAADGKLTATMDSVDQGARGIPIDSVSFADNKLKFAIDRISGSYEGTYNAEKKTIAGTWTQGGNPLPLDFAPFVEKPKVAYNGPKSDIEGYWMGSIDTGAQTLRVALRITTEGENKLSATADSPDQKVTGIPVTSITREGDTLNWEIKSLMATYKGTIRDPKKKIEGTLTQAGNEFPLVLERQAEEAK